MKKRFTQGIVTAALLLAGASASMAQFTLDGQYRPRFELRNGFKTPIKENTDPAAFIEHRARLTAGYKQEKLGFKLSVQDVRIWGETGQINKSDNLLSVHEAYGEYYVSSNSTFRIGRQELAYDGHRFIGTLGWAAQARAFDAVKYSYKNDSTGLQLDIIGAWNQSGNNESAPEPAKLTGTYYTTAGGPASANGPRIFNLPLPKAQLIGYGKKKFGEHDLALMGILESRESYDANGVIVGGPFSQYHLGLTGNFKVGSIKIGTQGYYSGGTFSRGYNDPVDPNKVTETSLSGYMFNATVQATKAPGKPLVGVDYLSGDDKTTADKVEGWAPLYGTNHKFYGFMDYFYVGNGHNGGGNNLSGGLIDLYLKTTFKLGDKSKLLAHLHGFMSPTDVADPTSADPDATQSSYLGTELDLVYVNKLAPGVVLKVGYSQMFTTDAMQQVKGQFGNDTPGEYDAIQGLQSWGWVMIDFTPKFLN